jgi:hypothetical protein
MASCDIPAFSLSSTGRGVVGHMCVFVRPNKEERQPTTNNDGDGASRNLAVDFDHNHDVKEEVFDQVSCGLSRPPYTFNCDFYPIIVARTILLLFTFQGRHTVCKGTVEIGVLSFSARLDVLPSTGTSLLD